MNVPRKKFRWFRTGLDVDGYLSASLLLLLAKPKLMMMEKRLSRFETAFFRFKLTAESAKSAKKKGGRRFRRGEADLTDERRDESVYNLCDPCIIHLIRA